MLLTDNEFSFFSTEHFTAIKIGADETHIHSTERTTNKDVKFSYIHEQSEMIQQSLQERFHPESYATGENQLPEASSHSLKQHPTSTIDWHVGWALCSEHGTGIL